MPLNEHNTGNPIRGSSPLNKKLRKTCEEVIDQFEFADLGRGAGTRHRSEDGKVRLDLQMHTKDGTVNLQVQIDKFSVAAALIAPEVCEIEDPANQDVACQAVISVLKSSLETTTIWELTGTLP